ncbi:MAG: hypothetical protein WCA21_19405 [Terracidiphilus sp.]
MSLRKVVFMWEMPERVAPTKIILVLALLAVLPLRAQYPGQVSTANKDTPELRAIAVLEWTGEAGHPKASRLVPVAVFDQSQLEDGPLQDGSIYLARPVPLALAGEVEYVLQQNGQPLGIFDVKNSGREQGSWVGYGTWKPLPAPKPKPSMTEVAQNRIDDEESDRPVLHRKHHDDEEGTTGSGGNSGSDSSTSAPAPASDPDRPTLHRKDSTDTPESTGAQADDPDRPVLKKSRKKPEDAGHVDSLPDVTDPNRPRLKRGKSSDSGSEVLPTLMGIPPEMQQTVAVSDARNRPDHPWKFIWANPDDEVDMKTALEAIARDALGLTPLNQTKARKKAMPAAPAPLPAPLMDERFQVFELAYGSGATLVLSAHTDGPFAQQRFVTLIAQPDLYGHILVLLKSVTDGAHLDERPRMRLIDAVDALADNRGELLFELRGATQRQFALYRVLRGQAEKLFVTGAEEFGIESRE